MTRASQLAIVFLVACGSSTATQSTSGGTTITTQTPAGATEPSTPSGPVPPVAEQRPYVVKSSHGDRNDPYYWLRDDTRTDAAVLAYLTAENKYANAVMGPVKALEDTLFSEMRSRIKEDDSSVPVFENGYWYYSRYETGKQHPIYARRKGTMEAAEQILLDANQLANGHAFYKVGAYDVSRNNKILAWTDDVVGRNEYTLHLKDLESGQLLADTATKIGPGMAWANDNKTLFYVGMDATTLRNDRVFRHVLGGTAELVYKEDDGQYNVSIGNTKSRNYVMIHAGATTNSEVRLIDAAKPAGVPRVFLPRTKDHEYEVDHLDNRFVILTNADAKNFRIVEVPAGKQANRKAWKDIIPHRSDALVESFALYHGFIAASVRTGGMRKVQVLPTNKPSFFLDAEDPTYTMSVIDTPDPESKKVRYAYSSMTTPSSVYELDVTSKQKKLLKQEPVPGYDAAQYTSAYIHATAADGTKVPISIVYKKGTKIDGTAPLYVYGYGAYGASMNARFNLAVVSLLDRGWIYAVAHIRGGQEMGRAWYENGKLMKKLSSFTDFIAATEHLVATKYGASDQVFAEGGSAGGLLMGGILNLRGDLYRGVAAIVPWMDVVTTMLDESIPLTTNEYEEWGNPKDKAAYDYMLAYSPYDNIKAQGYPAIYVRTGLWDSQVQYYDPAKWVAKLRATKTDGNPIVFDIDMTSGHGGAAGRFDRVRQTARAYAFFLHVREQPDQRKR